MPMKSVFWTMKPLLVLFLFILLSFIHFEASYAGRPLPHSSKKHRMLKTNKLPSGSSPGLGHAYIDGGPVKAGGRLANILKNKLPSGPSPGDGNAYTNAGPIKARTTLQHKLPGGPSPGGGHGFINASPVKTISLTKLPSGPSNGVGH